MHRWYCYSPGLAAYLNYGISAVANGFVSPSAVGSRQLAGMIFLVSMIFKTDEKLQNLMNHFYNKPDNRSPKGNQGESHALTV